MFKCLIVCIHSLSLFICLFLSCSLCRLSTSPGSALSISRVLSQAAVIRFPVSNTVLRSSRGVHSYCLTMMTLYMVVLPVLYVQVGTMFSQNWIVLYKIYCLQERFQSFCRLFIFALCTVSMLNVILVFIIPCFVSSRIILLLIKQWTVKM